MARRSKCTPETIAKLETAIGLGMTYKLAAQYAGIGESTLYQWMKEAERGDPAKQEFAEALNRAEARGAAAALACIAQAAKNGTWQAAAWILERRYAYKRESIMKHADTRATEEEKKAQAVDPTTDEGKETIIAQISELPEDLILSALNRKSINT